MNNNIKSPAQVHYELDILECPKRDDKVVRPPWNELPEELKSIWRRAASVEAKVSK
jgi:hypothetical protein